MPKDNNRPRRLNRRRDKIDSRHYKGCDLNLCWCGYPETRWLIMCGKKWLGTRIYLKDAMSLVDQKNKENNG